jgi:hypothetical protein
MTANCHNLAGNRPATAGDDEVTYKDFEKYAFGCDHSEAVSLASADYVPATARRRLYVGGTGNVKVDTAGGETGITFNAVPVGFLDLHVTRIYKTGTTATNLVALW